MASLCGVGNNAWAAVPCEVPRPRCAAGSRLRAVPVGGALLGVPAPVPTGRIVAYTASVCVISLVILALQLLISLASDNQLLAVGAGMLGVLLSMIGAMAPTWAQYLTPWTYYSLVAPMTFTGSDPVYLDAPFPGALVLAIAGAVAFTVITTRLDRKEV